MVSQDKEINERLVRIKRANSQPHMATSTSYVSKEQPSIADPYGQEVLRRWGIRTDYYAVMQLLLGYPREGDRHPEPKPRKNVRILRF